jgi:acyl dehydratase
MSEQFTREFLGITESALDDLRKRIGVKIERTLEPWCYEATRDNIRHYAHGIGDDNPLWCDPDYAQTTVYGDIVAPPSFVFACSRIISGYVGGLPGIHAMWAGADFNWLKPIMRNTEISTEAYLKDLVEHETAFAGRSIQQIYHVDFFDQAGDKLADGDSWCFRTDRDLARETGTKYDKLKGREVRKYSEEELQRHAKLYEAERIRGSEPRYFEDIKIGEELPVLAKGPMTVTGFICYAQGWGGLYIRANKLAWQMQARHPATGIKNKFGIPDCPERVHWEEEFAKKVGAPGAYDYGPERCSWLSHAITNWIGDNATLTHLYSEIRRHNPEGDLLTIEGKVVNKREEKGKFLVDFELEAKNQDGELSASGKATASMPSR